MKKIFVLFIGLALMISACGGSSSSDDSGGGGGGGGGGGTGTTAETVTSGNAGYFVSISSSDSDTMTVGGETITIESGSSYIYRYVPAQTLLERFDDAYNAFNNYSCDNVGDQYPYTYEQNLYNIEICPDLGDGTSNIDVEAVNIQTGEISGTTCNFTLNGTSRTGIDLAIVGSSIFYQNSDNALAMRTTACSTETVLLASGADGNTGFTRYYAINDDLISVLDDTAANDEYVINNRSTSTGATEEPLGYLVKNAVECAGAGDDVCSFAFFGGDSALYWYYYRSDTGAFKVFRWPLTGDFTEIYSTTLSDDISGAIAIDDSGGKVVIGYKYVGSRDGNGYATSYETVGVLYDIAGDTETVLNIDGYFDDNMQMIVYE